MKTLASQAKKENIPPMHGTSRLVRECLEDGLDKERIEDLILFYTNDYYRRQLFHKPVDSIDYFKIVDGVIQYLETYYEDDDDE